MRYLPHTESEIREMLHAIGVPDIDALFAQIPPSGRLGRPLALEPSLDEASLMRHLEALADKNPAAKMVSFLGAGIYDHHVPPAVDQLLLRSEFYTAYTPYQAEVAQGTLQAIFEFQTIVSELFGMPLANASMYDGASAAAEAILMARRLTKRTRVLVSEAVHPEYLETIRTYVRGLPGGTEAIETVPHDATGGIDVAALERALDESGGGDAACVVVGYPNFFGTLGDLRSLADLVHAKGALLVTTTAEPYALALAEPPGAQGADIAVGEGQPLGISPQFGGPGCGLFACRDTREFLQNVPGRLCGETVDKNGERGYVLTLSTREQHIRRDRATSNICTNHALCALAITIRACLLGKRGFVAVAEQCLAKTEHVKKALVKSGQWQLPFSGTTFNEFVVRPAGASGGAGGNASKTTERVANARAQGILAGVELRRFYPTGPHADDLLIAVTEQHTRDDLDRLVAALTG